MAKDFEIFDPEFKEILLPDSRLEPVCTPPAVWAEGPVWLPERDAVVFSDVRANRMFVWSEKDGLDIFRQPSNYANGNTLDREGRLVTCEHGRRCVSRTEKDGGITVLVDMIDKKRFNSPNDVVVKSDGSIWFTDPPYGILNNDEGYMANSQIFGCWVYRFDPATGEIGIASSDVERPNGLCFSPDESIMYVADMSLHEFPTVGRRQITAFDVSGKTLVNGRKIADVAPGIPDGFRVDAKGRIFTSSLDSIQVFSPAGKPLGKIYVPELNANCTFGGREQNILYVAASTTLYRIRLNTGGVQYSHLL